MPKHLVPDIPEFPFKVENGITTKFLDPLLSQENPHVGPHFWACAFSPKESDYA